ncbi:hypothetical protein J6590_070568 [Homalodisca vitripennis]|nr:hypothetical protein J6590_070568 [Homalodisca vitripennis]
MSYKVDRKYPVGVKTRHGKRADPESTRHSLIGSSLSPIVTSERGIQSSVRTSVLNQSSEEQFHEKRGHIMFEHDSSPNVSNVDIPLVKVGRTCMFATMNC